MIAMAAGISGHKGRVHVAFGKPLDQAFENEKEVAKAVDEAIHSQYRLWPCNYIAHDVVYNGRTFSNEYSSDEKAQFLAPYDNLKPEVRRVVLQCFANPINSRNGSCSGNGRSCK